MVNQNPIHHALDNGLYGYSHLIRISHIIRLIMVFAR